MATVTLSPFTIEDLIKNEPVKIDADSNARNSPGCFAILYILHRFNISQNKLATMMNIARSTVNQWANGVSSPMSDSIPDIGRALESNDLKDAAETFWFLFRNYDRYQNLRNQRGIV